MSGFEHYETMSDLEMPIKVFSAAFRNIAEKLFAITRKSEETRQESQIRHAQDLLREEYRLLLNICNIEMAHKLVQVHVSKKEVNLTRLVDNIREIVEDTLNIHVGGEMPGEDLWVEAEESILFYTLLGVVRNSIQFNCGDSIEIYLSLFKNSNWATVEILDNGVGIPYKSLPYIYDPYFMDATRESDSKGLGLGMALLYRSMQHFGGRTNAKNRPDGGTQVVIRMPVTFPPNGASSTGISGTLGTTSRLNRWRDIAHIQLGEFMDNPPSMPPNKSMTG